MSHKVALNPCSTYPFFVTAIHSGSKGQNQSNHESISNTNLNNSNNTGQDTGKTTKQSINQANVANPSDHTLTDAEYSLLQKGLNFYPTPSEPKLGQLN